MIELSHLSKILSERAEMVCKHYLSNGSRVGRYWIVGDVRNTKGGSMKVRLFSSGGYPAGRWVDYSSGEYGDLLDVIRLSQGLANMHDTIREANVFLSLHRHTDNLLVSTSKTPSVDDRETAVKRLWAIAKPISGTLAEKYLRARGIILNYKMASLRFHPRCFFKSGDKSQHLPAMIAAFTNDQNDITGLHRTFLDPSGAGKAAITEPRKAMGEISGSSIRFNMDNGDANVQLVGEGIETVLSLHCLMPSVAMQAASSATHLASIPFGAYLQRLYIAHDNDKAGSVATERLMERAMKNGIETIVLMPQYNDFNDDLRNLDTAYLRQRLRLMLHPQDRHLCQVG